MSFFALGLCSGLVFHVMAVSLGVSLLLKESPVAFMSLKFLGAAYLIWLGVKVFVNRGCVSFRLETEVPEVYKLYRKGIFMNLLNPKVILFFLAFFPQFINADAGNPVVQMCLLGAIFILQAFVIFSVVAFLAAKLSAGLMRNPKVPFRMNVVESVVYCVIGISILFL